MVSKVQLSSAAMQQRESVCRPHLQRNLRQPHVWPHEAVDALS